MSAFLAFAWGMVLRPFSKGWADTDPFAGTDFVGKTRAGEHESYYINYWGTSPSERDHGVIIRKMPLGAAKRPIYQESELDKLPSE